MKASSYRPRVHLFVCANRRSDDDPLGGGCGARGDAVFDAFKAATRARGLVSAVWVTKTHCLGLCPKIGCTVGIAPAMRYLVDVETSSVDEVLDALQP